MAARAAPAARLWVMLPGAYMKPQDFLAAGFADALAERGLDHDVALLEAAIPEVADGSALRYLQAWLRDEPQVAGREVWLLGISLGAHLAMACLARAPRGAAEAAAAARGRGTCLLAPYLGPREIAAEVAAAGGLAEWRAPTATDEDIDREIWRWLQAGRGKPCPHHLGYGSEDRFHRAHALMAQALPPSQVDVVPGGHDWTAWRHLWNRHLDRLADAR